MICITTYPAGVARNSFWVESDDSDHADARSSGRRDLDGTDARDPGR